MPSLTELIECYIKQQIEKNTRDMVEIRRRELAQKFNCVPSQINYVLDTRFTLEKGYMIESRRGGGGYIRIIKVNNQLEQDLLTRLCSRNDRLTQHEAERIIDTLYEEQFISENERILLRSAANRKTIGLKLPLRDQVRARLLKNMLTALFNN